jgi:hypothetical protein
MRSGWSSTQLPIHPLRVGWGKPLDLAGQPQLQRLAQFVEAHQHPAFLLEAGDHHRVTVARLLLTSLPSALPGWECDGCPSTPGTT